MRGLLGLLLLCGACSGSAQGGVSATVHVGGSDNDGGGGASNVVVHGGKVSVGGEPTQTPDGGMAGESGEGGAPAGGQPTQTEGGMESGGASIGGAVTAGESSGGAVSDGGSGGAPECKEAPPQCDTRKCGSVANSCGDTVSCGECATGSSCIKGGCYITECGVCASDAVCTLVSGFGYQCIPLKHAGGCDPDVKPNPGNPCYGYCDGKSEYCSGQYYDCGQMKDAQTGESCGMCSDGMRKYYCGPKIQ